MRTFLVPAVFTTALVAQPPQVAFEPASGGVVGDPIRIVASATPGSLTTLVVTRIDRYGRTWRSRSDFRVGADGRIDLARDAPEPDSSYQGIDPLGPLWSMQRQTGAKVTRPAQPGETLTAQLVSRAKESQPATILRSWRKPGVTSRPIDAAGLVGELFVPRGTGPHPTLLVVGDSGGGLNGQRRFAELLASHGYAALALAHFDAPGLPAALQGIPLSYFDRAIDWLDAQPEIDGRRLAVLGGSKGGELGLLLASREARLGAVVAIAPSSVVFQGIPSQPVRSSWSVDGEPLPFAPYKRTATFDKTRRLADLYAASLDAAPAAAVIPVENIRGPVLLLAGGQDNMWPAARMARAIRDRLKARRHPFAVELLEFADAGHEVGGPGFLPAHAARSMGGTPRGKAHALAAAWPKTLAFLDRHVRGSTVRADVGDHVDAIAAPLLANRVLSGILLITEGERIVCERSWGMADFEHRVPNRIDTRFCIESISKPITRALLRQLIARRRIRGRDTIARWLPTFPRGAEITVDMLQTHRSGLPHRVGGDQTSPTTAQEMAARAAKAQLLFAPGTAESYSSAGYSVLAHILELAGGQPFGALVAGHICRPLGLERTSHVDSSRVLPGRARPYLPGIAGPENAPPQDTSFLVGAGSIWSTAGDLHKLALACQTDRLGFRANDADWRGRTLGFAGFVEWLPDLGVHVIFLGNTPGGRDPLRAAIPAMLRRQPWSTPRPLPKRFPTDWKTLRSYEGTYRISPELTLRMRCVGGVLRCDRRAMLPIGPDRFYDPERHAFVSFVKDADSRVTGMLWDEGRGKLTIPRIGQ